MTEQPAKQFYPQQPNARYMALPPHKPMSAAKEVVAGTVGAVLVVNLVNSIGAPQGALNAAMQTVGASALLFGGPVALGMLATQFLMKEGDDIGKAPMQAVVASALAVTGMMLSGMLPWDIDMATLTTIGAGAAGIYGGVMVAKNL